MAEPRTSIVLWEVGLSRMSMTAYQCILKGNLSGLKYGICCSCCLIAFDIVSYRVFISIIMEYVDSIQACHQSGF